MSAWTGESEEASTATPSPSFRKLPETAGSRLQTQSKALTKAKIKEIRDAFPQSKAPAPPEEVRHWTELDLELWLGTDGLLRPRARWDQGTAQTSPLLTDLRLHLAEEKN